jgi:hypothetical protein
MPKKSQKKKKQEEEEEEEEEIYWCECCDWRHRKPHSLISCTTGVHICSKNLEATSKF